MVDKEVGAYRERISPSLTTLGLCIGQALSADGACQDAVARHQSKRSAQGARPCSLHSRPYCKARHRLPLSPWNAVPAALTSAGSLSGKIVIDCTNPLNTDYSGLSVSFTDSAGEQVARWAKDAKICKAFNHTGAQNMANPVFRGGWPAMFVCGDDETSRKTVLDLTGSIGFDPVDAGPLSSARLLEPLAMLWIHFAYGMKLEPDLAFGLLRR